MNLSVIQIILILFALFALTRTVQRFRDGSVSFVQLALWVIFWVGVVVVVILPDTSSKVASFFGVGRGADLVVYLALAIVFYLQFRLFVKTEEVERQITKLVRNQALDELEEKEDE